MAVMHVCSCEDNKENIEIKDEDEDGDKEEKDNDVV